ncbi:unnamed protein product [Thelazia callipaeda]|uniref:DUF2013 domain-containing protein n=1 Tax=Thelazia callipaeda TaxID=103827 RepID=A0A0N5D036_THECL|nr:unnamed protein product [Thelazia callipaeda]
MYSPVLNFKEKARELVDMVRKETDAPVISCINTVSNILNDLAQNLPNVYSLNGIRDALEEDDLIDVDNCYDAMILEQLMVKITGYVEQKSQDKADIRVSTKQFRQDNYAFIEQLVLLYQLIEIRTELLAILLSLCSMDRSMITVLLNGQLPIFLTIENDFSLPLSKICVLSLRLLTTLFSTGEKFPISHYDILNLKFLETAVSLAKYSEDAFEFILSFNVHFQEYENIVIQALHNVAPIMFGLSLIVKLNQCRADNEDLRALKLMVDIFCCSDHLIKTLFYDNDLRTLYIILCKDLIDTNLHRKFVMILKLMNNVELIKRCGVAQDVLKYLKIFLLTRELQTEMRHSVEFILQQVAEQLMDESCFVWFDNALEI